MTQEKATLLQFLRAVGMLRGMGAWATALDIQKEINRAEIERTTATYGFVAVRKSVDWPSVAAHCGKHLTPAPNGLEGYYFLDEIRPK